MHSQFTYSFFSIIILLPDTRHRGLLHHQKHSPNPRQPIRDQLRAILPISDCNVASPLAKSGRLIIRVVEKTTQEQVNSEAAEFDLSTINTQTYVWVCLCYSVIPVLECRPAGTRLARALNQLWLLFFKFVNPHSLSGTKVGNLAVALKLCNKCAFIYLFYHFYIFTINTVQNIKNILKMCIFCKKNLWWHYKHGHI